MKNSLLFLVVLLLFITNAEQVWSSTNLFLRANQLGYRTGDAKVAVAFSNSSFINQFQLVEAQSGKEAFTGTHKPVNGAWGRHSHHAELDFSEFKKPGKYVLQIGAYRSLPFEIRNSVYTDLPDKLLEFMRQQRCGYNPWLDAVCHPFDGRTAFGPVPDGTYLPCSGGWHDAGDQLKYLLTSGNATAQLLLSYQLNSESRSSRAARSQEPPSTRMNRRHVMAVAPNFADKVNGLGQPGGNGIPDILDEAKWGLDWMLKLHPAPDQLYHQIADDRDHAGWRLPQNEHVDYGWGPGKERVVYFANGKPQGLQQYKSDSTGVANLAGRYAAAMGLAWQIWKDNPRMSIFAEQCLKAGKEVYALGKAKKGVQQGNSYKAPYRYEETTWADDMEWGATELYRATGDKQYLEDAKEFAVMAANDTWMPHEQTKHYQYYPFMNIGHYRLYDLVDRKFKERLAGYYREGIEHCLARGQRNPFRIGVPFIWCSNNLTTALATQCLLYERMTGDQHFRQFAAQQRDWLLGTNPWGYTMFTEIGQQYPKDTHLFCVKLMNTTVRGGLVDGPVYERIFKSLKGVSITEPDPLAAFQDERAVYHDDFKDYSTNEPTMDGTASAILLWALMR